MREKQISEDCPMNNAYQEPEELNELEACCVRGLNASGTGVRQNAVLAWSRMIRKRQVLSAAKRDVWSYHLQR